MYVSPFMYFIWGESRLLGITATQNVHRMHPDISIGHLGKVCVYHTHFNGIKYISQSNDNSCKEM